MLSIFCRYPALPSSILPPLNFVFHPFSSWTSQILSQDLLEIRRPQVSNPWPNASLTSLSPILPTEGSKTSRKPGRRVLEKEWVHHGDVTLASPSPSSLTLPHPWRAGFPPSPLLSYPWSTETSLQPSLPRVFSLLFGSWSQSHFLAPLYPKSRLVSVSPRTTIQSFVVCPCFPLFSLQRWRRERGGCK